MVLRWRRRGRVGSCRKRKARDNSRAFFVCYGFHYRRPSPHRRGRLLDNGIIASPVATGPVRGTRRSGTRSVTKGALVPCLTEYILGALIFQFIWELIFFSNCTGKMKKIWYNVNVKMTGRTILMNSALSFVFRGTERCFPWKRGQELHWRVPYYFILWECLVRFGRMTACRRLFPPLTFM